jgi:6-phosphogluconolactonase
MAVPLPLIEARYRVEPWRGGMDGNVASKRHLSRRLSRGTFLKGATGLLGASIALATSARWAEVTAAGPVGETKTMATSPGVTSRAARSGAAAAKPMVLYFGTGANGQGIHVFELDQVTGRLTQRDLTPVAAPGWIDLDPTERFLYASIADSQIASFAVDQASGRLTPLNTQQNGTTGAPHLSVHRSGRWVVTASYNGGTVSVLAVEPDGRLGEIVDLARHSGEPGPHPNQSQARAHQAHVDRTRRWIAVPDLGLDRVYVYRLDADTGKLIAADPPFVQVERGRGPRHISFHPNGRLAYVINELNSTMTAFEWDSATGVLRELQTLTTLPDGWGGRQWSAQVMVHPSGRFVYGSNRGSGGESDDIAIFRIDERTGLMAPAGHAASGGQVPRNFTIDPTGRLLICAHQDSPNVVPFWIDEETGALTPTGQSVEVANVICVQFAPGIA